MLPLAALRETVAAAMYNRRLRQIEARWISRNAIQLHSAAP